MGLAVLAGGLAFVGNARATELVIDGSFENVEASSNPVVKVGGKEDPGVGEGWSTFSTYLYSTQYTMPGPVGSGTGYLRPYPSGQYGITRSSTEVFQWVSLTSGTTLTPAKIDAGNGRYTMSAWFSSYLATGDYSDLTLEFLDGGNQVVGDPVPLGGADYIAAIPTAANAKFNNAKEWSRDSKEGTIPAGARSARVTLKSTAMSGAPDGYVDVVSLDVADTALVNPAVIAADPGNGAVGVGPLVNLSVTLQDRATAVDPSSIRLLLDETPVTPTIEKVDVNTTVKYQAGVLPALSSHVYRIIFGDTGSPAKLQTNEYRFTTANFLTLPSSLRSPLGSEDTSKPGFTARVVQVAPIEAGDVPPTQINLPKASPSWRPCERGDRTEHGGPDGGGQVAMSRGSGRRELGQLHRRRGEFPGRRTVPGDSRNDRQRDVFCARVADLRALSDGGLLSDGNQQRGRFPTHGRRGGDFHLEDHGPYERRDPLRPDCHQHHPA